MRRLGVRDGRVHDAAGLAYCMVWVVPATPCFFFPWYLGLVFLLVLFFEVMGYLLALFVRVGDCAAFSCERVS